jgi:hypothetical protein
MKVPLIREISGAELIHGLKKHMDQLINWKSSTKETRKI